MSKTEAGSSDPALRNLQKILPNLEALYKDVHSHPELSMQETRTAGLAAERCGGEGMACAKRVVTIGASTDDPS